MKNIVKLHVWRGDKIRLLTLALTVLLAGCPSSNNLVEPTPPPAPATYTLTLDANGGSLATGANATQQLASSSRATRPADPMRAQEGRWDFTFAYWSADKKTSFNFNTPVTKTSTLYAMWSVALPDANFRDLLKKHDLSNAFDGDRLVVSHASVTGLTSINASQLSISDLSGIEFFTTLTELNCSGNRLTTLDVSQNTALTALSCSSNQLSSLNVSGATALTELNCSGNRLATLDVSRNAALTTLWCGSNQLSSLNVSGATALTELRCDSNQLTALDVSRNTALTSLSCSSNQLASLDMRGMRSVSDLSLGNNPNLVSLKVHIYSNKDGSEVYKIKTRRGSALIIELYSGSGDNYTKTCSNYQPGDNTAGTCLTQ